LEPVRRQLTLFDGDATSTTVDTFTVPVEAVAGVVSTVVEVASPSNNVSCRLTGSNSGGTAFSFSGNANLTTQVTAFGVPVYYIQSVVVPGGLSGAVSVDCLVNPGGKIHVAHENS
jgi:hypothetical protein